MTAAMTAAGGKKYLTLAAMIFAVSMTFIDMTIVSIAVPEIQKELSLSSTGIQWVVNGYLLALAALFAFGGRLSDIVGHKKMVLLGVVIFTFASAMNGLTPDGSAAEVWIVSFRILQGAGAAIMYPAALAIVVKAFPLRERGKAMAIFFAVAGGLTAVGPFAGGYLSAWTWRAIFWVNIPVAIIAVILTLKANPADDRVPGRMDYRGLALIVFGMGLSVLGFQQSSVWGWGSPLTIGCIVVGLAFLVVFVLVERGTESPLIDIAIFKVRAFTAENVVLFFSMGVFVPVFFFASMYAQISLGNTPSNAGLYLLIFFAGFAPASQVGGRMLDSVGAKRPVVFGCALAAVGFALWAQSMTDLTSGSQWIYMIVAGAGMGMMVGPANTDAVNRAPSTRYGEATGITQTVRNYGSSLGLALLGTLLITINTSHIEASLQQFGMPQDQADEIAHSMSQAGGGDQQNFQQQSSQPDSQDQQIFKAVQEDFSEASQAVFYAMAGIMAVAALCAFIGLRPGRQEDLPGAVGDKHIQASHVH